MKETKFRRLRRDELEEVKGQFVKFLSVNGIDADSWVKIKANDPQRADALILQFSQIVFSGVIERVEYLVQRKPHDLRTYRTGPDKIEMRGLLISGETSVDLTNPDTPPEEIFRQLQADGARPKIYSAERAYLPIGRDQDIFLRMEEGALIDDGQLFQLLDGLS
ncbi:hypothetical protein GGR26_001520 [Lewinella marina]|uniref:Uncharacterized protein n=1 Tax=Neolewinella marina TaxID=438751 RepID=A0A2G0CEZ7_9BACT|nr:DUF6495 family protein [Neolewinella marina]NJB85775.1 hypothetical protein [Neolewinella marina]PHK98553.1 hypothetical protein CGL56_08745 [Neolewinella marina]